MLNLPKLGGLLRRVRLSLRATCSCQCRCGTQIPADQVMCTACATGNCPPPPE